jgi:hypothetical protein
LDINRILYNNVPQDELAGLTPSEIHQIIYEPLGKRSIIRFKDNVSLEVLSQIPLLQLTVSFLELIHREKELKLTKTGALPVKVVKELYGLGYLKDPFIEAGLYKLNKESDSQTISALHINTKFAKLIKHSNSKLTLTKQGEKLLNKDRRQQLMELVIATFLNKLNIGHQDNFTDIAIGQLAWGFSFYLLHKAENKELTTYEYGNLFLTAFPNILAIFEDKEYKTPEEFFLQCYSFRLFTKIFNWLGFITYKKGMGEENFTVKSTGLIDKIFTFDN